MKNALVCLLTIALVGICGSAQALTSFEDLVDFGAKGGQITNGTKYRNIRFSFYGIREQFATDGSTVPTLVLTIPKSARKFVNKLYMKVGSEFIFLNNITKNEKTFAFTGDNLALLNQAIENKSVTFKLAYAKGGKSVLSGAALQGTMAPEPASMALVAAGLCAVPFARRMRKSLTKAT